VPPKRKSRQLAIDLDESSLSPKRAQVEEEKRYINSRNKDSPSSSTQNGESINDIKSQKFEQQDEVMSLPVP